MHVFEGEWLFVQLGGVADAVKLPGGHIGEAGIVARGLSNYGLVEDALRIFDGITAAVAYFDDDRVPELFCGIARRARCVGSRGTRACTRTIAYEADAPLETG